MKLSVSTLADLDRAIATQSRADYVYMYPPRQAYRQLDATDEFLERTIAASLARQTSLNIYAHVPFCRQICGFCNLYTTSIRSPDVHAEYVTRILQQVDLHLPHLPDVDIPTIYIGGGTPTVLDEATLSTLIDGMLRAFTRRSPNCEIAIEVDPQTVTLASLKMLKQSGINRINLGLQTRDNVELKTIGRGYRSDEQWELASEAMTVGFSNVCVDLIYGLPGQSQTSWEDTLADCIELHPQTICCYPLTERPHTGFAKAARQRSPHSDYDMWTHADSILRTAGYNRQSHVRWARDGGGYRQKELHWGSENLLGFGAGARSYLWDHDFRNHYSIIDRSKALGAYMDRMSRGDFLPREGFAMNEEERLRKAVVLGLHHLDNAQAEARFGFPPDAVFQDEFTGLQDRGYLTATATGYALTDAGMKYRDLIVQLFFSERVRCLSTEHSYRE